MQANNAARTTMAVGCSALLPRQAVETPAGYVAALMGLVQGALEAAIHVVDLLESLGDQDSASFQ